jgi:hypothetical protein
MSELFQVRCPQCGKSYSLTPEQIPQYMGRSFACEQCGQMLVIGGTPAHPVALSSGAPPGPVDGDYAEPHSQRTSGLAIASLVAGILGLVIPLVPALIAIVTGALGLRQARDPAVSGKGMAVAGLVLGNLGIVMSVCMISVMVPGVTRAREAGRRIACQSNLRQVGVAVSAYGADHRGWLPPSLAPVLAQGYLPRPSAVVCPSTDHVPSFGATAPQQAANLDAGPHLSYVYVGAGLRLQDLAAPATVVLTYEPLANHGGAGSHFLFADGYVEWVESPRAEQLITSADAELAERLERDREHVEEP